MARTRPNRKMDSRESRRGLPAQADPHWLSLAPKESLGYHKPKGGAAGTWRARLYLPESRTFKKKSLGTADDFEDGDGQTVLTFAQAQKRAHTWFDDARREATGEPTHRGPLTVCMALEAYLADMDRQGKKSATDARTRAALHILPILGGIEVEKLTRLRLEKWRDALAMSPKARRQRIVLAPRPRAFKQPRKPINVELVVAMPPSTPDEKRARKATTNRVLSILKAALTYALQRNLVRCSDDSWNLTKPCKGTDQPRKNYLTPEEQQRLLNAIKEPDFKRLVAAALATGCRYGELCRMMVGDFDPVGGTMMVQESKSGKPRSVPLTPQGKAFFVGITAGRPRPEYLFMHEGFDGRQWKEEKVMRPWKQSEQQRPMKEACIAAGVPPMGFHQLRHSYASALVAAGMPLAYVAQLTGHASSRILEKYYAHLAPSDVKKALEAFAPSLDLGTAAIEALKIKKG